MADKFNEQCDSCFEEVRKNIDHVVNIAKNSIISMNHSHSESIEKRKKDSEKFFVAQEEKFDKYIERKEKRETKAFNVNMGVLAFLALVIGYVYLKQHELEKEMYFKANRIEIPTINELKEVIETGDKHNENTFVKKDIINDDSGYENTKKNIWGSVLRSGERVN